MTMTHQALFVHDDGTPPALRGIDLRDNPYDGDVVVRVLWSAINYKDALAVTGKGKIVRGAFPFIPGIDLAGEVISSESDTWQPGDTVLLTGWGLGENRWGAYSTIQRVPGEHVIALPDGMSPRDAMIAGTAGLTAMLGVLALERYGRPADAGDVLVTGASGGVGSFAVMALADAGFRVVASTGSPENAAYLTELGAAEVVDRREFEGGAARPLDSARWSGAIDSVGGATLASILSTTDRHGCVAACGLVGGHTLETTVFPFILRGVHLVGIDSNTCPDALRREAWDRLARVARRFDLAATATEVPLSGVVDAAANVWAGRTRGRVVVNVASP